jgi:acyl-coenzyme A thioesterase PaaI-like protein
MGRGRIVLRMSFIAALMDSQAFCIGHDPGHKSGGGIVNLMALEGTVTLTFERHRPAMVAHNLQFS